MFETALLTVASGKRGQDRPEVVRHQQGIVVVADGAGGSGGGNEAADLLIMWVPTSDKGQTTWPVAEMT